MRKRRDRDADTQIRVHRARTEVRLSALLQRAKSGATLNDIKELIFYERPERKFGEYVADLIALIDPAKTGGDLDELLPILQDAWNYFPHLRLDGLCPAKLMLQHVPSLRPGSLRTRSDENA